jgi:hypothetical protein
MVLVVVLQFLICHVSDPEFGVAGELKMKRLSVLVRDPASLES